MPDPKRDFSNFQQVMQGFQPVAQDPFVAAAQAQMGQAPAPTPAVMAQPPSPAPMPVNPMAPEPGGFTGLDTNQAAINQRLAELQMLMGQAPAPAPQSLGMPSETEMARIGQPPPQSLGMPSETEISRMSPAPQLAQADMMMPMETIRAGGSTMNMPQQTITPQNNAPREIQELFSGFKPEVKLEALQGLGVGQSQPAVQNPATGGANNAEKSLAESGLQVLGAGAGNADPIPSSPGNPYILGSPDWIAYEQYASGAR